MSMTIEEVQAKVLLCLDIDPADYDPDDDVIGCYTFDEDEVEGMKKRLQEEFDIEVHEMDVDTTIKEIIDALYEHTNK